QGGVLLAFGVEGKPDVPVRDRGEARVAEHERPHAQARVAPGRPGVDEERYAPGARLGEGARVVVFDEVDRRLGRGARRRRSSGTRRDAKEGRAQSRDGLHALQIRAFTFSRTHSTIDSRVAPGVKTPATPAFFSGSRSDSGMMPPPKTTMSFAPRFFSSSMTAGNSVLWAPLMIDRPTPSTSSCTAAPAIISGVWCRPV